jgi:charged multivesicular body protein 7
MFTLKEEFYPKEWTDDQRMGMLLAEFRVKSLNPENYEAKMKFWREMICKYCLEQKQSSNVTLNELKVKESCFEL